MMRSNIASMCNDDDVMALTAVHIFLRVMSANVTHRVYFVEETSQLDFF